MLNYRKDGTPFWVELDIKPIADSKGWYHYWVSVQRNVTLRKSYEEELEKTVKHLHQRTDQLADEKAELWCQGLVAKHTSDAAIVTDADGRTIWVNQGFTACTGYTLAEMIGMKPGEILTGPDTDPAVSKQMGDAIREQRFGQFEILNYHKSGRPFWVDIRISPVFAPGGELTNFIAIEQDVTEKKQALLLLEDNEERLDLALKGSNDGIWDWDLLTDKIYRSENNFVLLGDTPVHDASDSAKWWIDRVHPEDKDMVYDRTYKLIDHDTPYDVTYRMRHNDGSWRWWRSRAQAIRNDEGKAIRIIGGNNDVTELLAAKELAKEANRLKSEFLANMSHEIRTPLNGVLGMAQLLERTDLNEKQTKYVSTIMSSGKALLSVISDVLDLSKIEAGLVTVEHEPFNVDNLLTEAVEAVLGVAIEKGLSVTSTRLFQGSADVIGDEKRLKQILINFAGNAVKFTDKGSVIISAQRAENNWIRFSVKDTGPGIPHDQHTRIFDRFTQADGSSTRKHGGTGLGLAISQDLARLLGGTVGVISDIGKGAEFWVALPLDAAAEEVEEISAGAGQELSLVSPTSAIPDQPRYNILLAEDNEVNQLMVEEALALFPDVNLVIVENGAEALDHLSKKQFDLILMDINMPVLTGDEAIKQIRSTDNWHKDTPIIVLTANALQSQQQHYMEIGADDYLSKPINIDELVLKVSARLKAEAA